MKYDEIVHCHRIVTKSSDKPDKPQVVYSCLIVNHVHTETDYSLLFKKFYELIHKSSEISNAFKTIIIKLRHLGKGCNQILE